MSLWCYIASKRGKLHAFIEPAPSQDPALAAKLPLATQTLELSAIPLWQDPYNYPHLLLGSQWHRPRQALQKLHMGHVCSTSAGTTDSHIYLGSYVPPGSELHIASHHREVHVGSSTAPAAPPGSLQLLPSITLLTARAWCQGQDIFLHVSRFVRGFSATCAGGFILLPCCREPSAARCFVYLCLKLVSPFTGWGGKGWCPRAVSNLEEMGRMFQ